MAFYSVSYRTSGRWTLQTSANIRSIRKDENLVVEFYQCQAWPSQADFIKLKHYTLHGITTTSFWFYWVNQLLISKLPVKSVFLVAVSVKHNGRTVRVWRKCQCYKAPNCNILIFVQYWNRLHEKNLSSLYILLLALKLDLDFYSVEWNDNITKINPDHGFNLKDVFAL